MPNPHPIVQRLTQRDDKLDQDNKSTNHLYPIVAVGRQIDKQIAAQPLE